MCAYYQPGAVQYKERVSGVHRLGGKPSKALRTKTPTKKIEGAVDPAELMVRLAKLVAQQQAHAERKQRTRWDASNPWAGFNQPASTRHLESAKPGRKGRQEPATTSADLITELRRSKSTKRKSASTDIAVAELEAPGSLPAEYHHVPREAAKQFTRTTTVDNMRNDEQIHPLSKRALKYHMEAPQLSQADEANCAPSKLSQALQRTQSQRDKVLDRNQFQRTRALEDAAHMDAHEQLSPRTRKHTFEDELSRIVPEGHPHHHQNPRPSRLGSWHLRRNSTGNAAGDEAQRTDESSSSSHARRSIIGMEPLLDAVAEDGIPPPLLADDPSRFAPPHERRVDWTQSDEPSRSRPRLLSLPLLRKADSLWALRRTGSRGSSTGDDKGNGGGGQEKEGVKPSKPGFFARFKR
jgi:hypothetical protein